MMNKKLNIQGGCHCGNIRYRYEIKLALDDLSIRACTCSFCIKQGVIYTSNPEGKLNVLIKSRTDINHYQFSSKHINFIFCSVCGVMPIATTKINEQLYAVINIKTADNELRDRQVEKLDLTDETIDEALARRKSKWISEVNGL